MNINWNSVESNNYPDDDRDVFLTVISGDDGQIEKAVAIGNYDHCSNCWVFFEGYNYGNYIVVAWSDFPEPYSGRIELEL